MVNNLHYSQSAKMKSKLLRSVFDLTNSMKTSVNSAHNQYIKPAYQNKKQFMINVLFTIRLLINTSINAKSAFLNLDLFIKSALVIPY